MDESRNKLTASIRQAAPSYVAAHLNDLPIGTIVHGRVLETQSDNIVVTLEPSGVQALVSIQQLADTRGITVAQLKDTVKIGDELDHLRVTSKDAEKYLVTASAALPQEIQVDLKAFAIGTIVNGEVIRRAGTVGSVVHIESSGSVCGMLHPTDTSDNYDVALSSESPLPPLHSMVHAMVVGINTQRHRLILSTRASRLDPSGAAKPRDPEINDLKHLKVGDKVRGFVKNIMEHGLFISIGRDLDAHVRYPARSNQVLFPISSVSFLY